MERFLYLQGYSPSQNLTRAQFAALSARLAGLNFPIERAYVLTTPRVPVGQPAASEEIELSDVPSDAPEDMPMQIYMEFAAGGTSLKGHNAGLMLSTLGDGNLAGFRQVHGC
ncbi:MAG: hypothetical protein IPK75_20570 [Acidobacteria bacterium]|nr:hypothetical protein [Acidobacteriota bacterium]